MTLIRHAKVKYSWDEKYNSDTFSLACSGYDAADIESIDKKTIAHIQSIVPDESIILTSKLKRSIETGMQLFPDKQQLSMHELDEVPVLPYTSTPEEKPLWKWMMYGRVQWYFNNERQTRNRNIVEKEIDEILKTVSRYEDATIVGHGFYFRIMLKMLRKKGWKYKMNGRIRNLDIIKCEK